MKAKIENQEISMEAVVTKKIPEYIIIGANTIRAYPELLREVTKDLKETNIRKTEIRGKEARIHRQI